MNATPLFVFALASFFANDVIGVPRNFENRIVNSMVAVPGQFRYQAALNHQTHGHFCSGSIIKPFYVLTSAICVYGNWSQGIYVVVGTNDLTMGGSHISVQSIKIHEQYDNATSKNNIALIRTASNILSVPQTSTVALGIASTLPGQMCTLTGWGKEYLAMPLYSNILRYAQFSVLSLDECRWYLYGIHNSEICTNPSTSGGCDGDNGGPLVTVADNVQIGILSRGVPCAMGKPDVYTNVAHYSNWIDQHSGSMISALSPFFLALLLSSCCLM